MIMKRYISILILLSFMFGSPNAYSKDSLKANVITDNVTHGLVVLLGDNPENTISLAAKLTSNNRYLVQCLAADSKDLEKLRSEIAKRKLSGRVTVRKLTGSHLPYADNMVNGVVGQSAKCKVSGEEIDRVLAPRGVAVIKKDGNNDLVSRIPYPASRIGDDFVKLIKPIPSNIDDWTHFQYDASGSMVGKDGQAGVIRHLQWVAGPKQTRSHEQMSSITAVVSEGGRIYSIVDEGPTASIYLPPKIRLVARDAFNGILLWKQPIPEWFNPLYPLKSGPHKLARRLVAVNGKVYVTLGINAPVSIIDGETGKIDKILKGTENTSEILWVDNKLVLLAKDSTKGLSSILVYDLKAKKISWKNEPKPWAHTTLTSDGKRVYCYTVGQIACFDILTGKQTWKNDVYNPKITFKLNEGPGLVIYKNVLVFASRSNMTALKAETGEQLWQKNEPISDFKSPTRAFIINGLIWKAANKAWPNNGAVRNGTEKGLFKGFDYLTGGLKKGIDIDPKVVGIIHHRCSIPKATGKYILSSWPGIEFVDTENKTIKAHNWIRGACLYGIMPANGMVYAPPNPCVCYNQGRPYGYLAVNSGNTETASILKDARLEKGSAYTDSPTRHSTLDTQPQAAWPTYRGDNARSGYTSISLKKNPSVKWKVKVGSNLTPPIAADKGIYFADKDTRTVYALDAEKGKTLWRYTPDGAVDSPPTYYKGSLYFGCRDGYVYCLDAASGTLKWRFLAAKEDRQIISYNKVESQWPIHGSVTIVNSKLYFVTGRNPFMDKGMDLYCLDSATGKQIAVKPIFSLNEKNEHPPLAGVHVTGLNIDTSGPDILSADSRHLFLRHKTISLDNMEMAGELKGVPHLYASMGFLDGNFHHRTYWVYDKGTVAERYAWMFGRGSGAVRKPKGKKTTPKPAAARQSFGSHLTVMDAGNVYHFGKKAFRMSHPKKTPSPVYLLTSTPKKGSPVSWSIPTDVWIRSMVVTDESLYIAGPAGKWHTDMNTFQGRKKIVLRCYNKKNGKMISETALDAMPVFNGMAGANGKLYVSLQDGSISCMQ